MKKVKCMLLGVSVIFACSVMLVSCRHSTGTGGGGEESRVPPASAPDFVTISAKSMSLNKKGSYHVTLTKAYMICDHEVTQTEWEAIMGNNPSNFQGEAANKKVANGEVQENRPVEKVSWYDAIAYCNKRSINEGLTPCYSVKVGGTEVDWKNLEYSAIPTSDNADWNAVVCDFSKNGYRLPTEAEWEIAARGGLTGDVYAGTDDVNELGDYAWYVTNSDSRTHEVKKKLPNGYGLYDMSGNVLEWCWDWEGSYVWENATATAIDPRGASTGSKRVIRSGHWLSNDYECSVYRLSNQTPFALLSGIGLRVVRSA